MSFLLALLLASIVSVFLLAVRAWSRAREAELRRTAFALGLEVEQGGWTSSGPRVTGTFAGVRVCREPYVVSTGKSSQRFTRFIAYGVPREVTVKREGFGQRVLKALGSEDQLVGDPLFDEQFVVKGDPVTVSASLPDDARTALAMAASGNTTMWVDDGEVVVQVAGDVIDLPTVRARLEMVTRVARAMRVEAGGGVLRLARVARDDVSPGARARAMALLAEVDPRRAEPVLREGLGDPDTSVRVHAALLLGDAAAIRRLLASPGLPVLGRVKLLGALADPAAAGELVELLTHADADVRSAAVAGLAAVGGRDEVEPLRALAQREGWGEASRRAEAAIAAIQSRLGDVDAGRLALADESAPLAGAVSEAGPAGAVSVASPTGRREGAAG